MCVGVLSVAGFVYKSVVEGCCVGSDLIVRVRYSERGQRVLLSETSHVHSCCVLKGVSSQPCGVLQDW